MLGASLPAYAPNVMAPNIVRVITPVHGSRTRQMWCLSSLSTTSFAGKGCQQLHWWHACMHSATRKGPCNLRQHDIDKVSNRHASGSFESTLLHVLAAEG